MAIFTPLRFRNTGGPQQVTDPQGFDEFMNVVIDETVQIYQPKKDGGKAVKEPEELGRILLKGESNGVHMTQTVRKSRRGVVLRLGSSGVVRWS